MLSVAAAIVLKSWSEADGKHIQTIMWNQDLSTQHVCSAYQAWIRFRIWLNNQILMDWTWACDRDFCKSRISHSTQIKWIMIVQDNSNTNILDKKTCTSCSGPWNTWSTGPSFSLHQELKVSKDFFSWNGWVQIPPSGWLIENENPPVWDTPNTYVVGSSHVFHCFPFDLPVFTSTSRAWDIVLVSNRATQPCLKPSSGQRGQRHLTEVRLIRKNTTLTQQDGKKPRMVVFLKPRPN